jgi:hypothetical protein
MMIAAKQIQLRIFISEAVCHEAGALSTKFKKIVVETAILFVRCFSHEGRAFLRLASCKKPCAIRAFPISPFGFNASCG